MGLGAPPKILHPVIKNIQNIHNIQNIRGANILNILNIWGGDSQAPGKTEIQAIQIFQSIINIRRGTHPPGNSVHNQNIQNIRGGRLF